MVTRGFINIYPDMDFADSFTILWDNYAQALYMGERVAATWRVIWLALVICAVTLIFSAQALSTESVHAELVRLQIKRD